MSVDHAFSKAAHRHRAARGRRAGRAEMQAVQRLSRKASAALEAAVDKVDRVSAPPTPTRRPSEVRELAAGAHDTPPPAARAEGGGASDGPDLSRVPKSDVIALCVKTGRRLQAVEMQYAQLKAMHQVCARRAPRRRPRAMTRRARRGAAGAP